MGWGCSGPNELRAGGAGIVALVNLLREREARIDELVGQVVARTESATLWQARAELLAIQSSRRARPSTRRRRRW